jgi:hypothetical protein
MLLARGVACGAAPQHPQTRTTSSAFRAAPLHRTQPQLSPVPLCYALHARAKGCMVQQQWLQRASACAPTCTGVAAASCSVPLMYSPLSHSGVCAQATCRGAD